MNLIIKLLLAVLCTKIAQSATVKEVNALDEVSRSAERVHFLLSQQQKTPQQLLGEKFDPQHIFDYVPEAAQSEIISNRSKILTAAITKLVESTPYKLTPGEVMLCLFDLETCYKDGVEQVNLQKPYIGDEFNPFVEDPVPRGTCGDTVTVHPGETVMIEFNNYNDVRCSVFIQTEVSKDKYYFDFIKQSNYRFQDCEHGYFEIRQKGKKLIENDYLPAVFKQRYCSGTFMLTEFPTEADHAVLSYVNMRVNEKSSIKFFIRSNKLEEPRVDYINLRDVGYTKTYSVSNTIVPRSFYKTFDPKYAAYQTCPLECGMKVTRWNRLPETEIPPFFLLSIDEAEVPWYVGVRISKDNHYRTFGGSILNSRTILTAANYLIDVPLDSIFIRVRPYGEWAHSKVAWQHGNVVRKILHPDFRPLTIKDAESQKYRHDIAILHLAEPLKLGFEAVPVCLAPPGNYKGNLLQTLRPKKVDNVNYLTEAYSIHWRPSWCRDNQSIIYSDEVICHSYHEDLETEENIGSPVMIKMRTTWFQVGVLSQYFVKESMQTMIRYSTNVAYHLNFIRENLLYENAYCS